MTIRGILYGTVKASYGRHRSRPGFRLIEMGLRCMLRAWLTVTTRATGPRSRFGTAACQRGPVPRVAYGQLSWNGRKPRQDPEHDPAA